MAEERLQRLEDSIIGLVDSLKKDHTEKERKKHKKPVFKFKGNERRPGGRLGGREKDSQRGERGCEEEKC